MKSVFLTGASSGIGLATAQLLTQNGYQVWGTSRTASKLPVLQNFHPVELDLKSIDSVHAAFRKAEQEAVHFDVLINNAGEGILAPLEAFSPEQIREQFEVLLIAPHELIRLVLPSMRLRLSGTILNISSLAAQFPVPFLGPYSAAKAALASYSETLRLELTGTRIRVMDLQPGDIATSFPSATRRIDAPVNSAYAHPMQAAWEVMNSHMTHGPHPQLVAEKILTILDKKQTNSPHRIGTFYQAVLSPFLARVLPKRLLEKGLRDYYQLRRLSAKS